MLISCRAGCVCVPVKPNLPVAQNFGESGHPGHDGRPSMGGHSLKAPCPVGLPVPPRLLQSRPGACPGPLTYSLSPQEGGQTWRLAVGGPCGSQTRTRAQGAPLSSGPGAQPTPLSSGLGAQGCPLGSGPVRTPLTASCSRPSCDKALAHKVGAPPAQGTCCRPA